MIVGHIEGSPLLHALKPAADWKTGYMPLCTTGNKRSLIVKLPGTNSISCKRCNKALAKIHDQPQLDLNPAPVFYLKKAAQGVYSSYHIYSDCARLISDFEPRKIDQSIIDLLELQVCNTCQKKQEEETSEKMPLGILTQVLQNHQQEMYGKPPQTQPKTIAKRQIVALEEAGFRYIRAPKGDKD